MEGWQGKWQGKRKNNLAYIKMSYFEQKEIIII